MANNRFHSAFTEFSSCRINTEPIKRYHRKLKGLNELGNQEGKWTTSALLLGTKAFIDDTQHFFIYLGFLRSSISHRC